MKRLNKEFLIKNVLLNIQKDIKASNIIGASVLVAQKGEVLLEESLGYSDIEKGVPLKKDSVFRIASMTKPITAAAALLAEEKGYFELTDPVSRHFPAFAYMQRGRLGEGRVIPDGRAQTPAALLDLLTHTSGFMCQSPLYALQYEAIPKPEFSSSRRMVDYCLSNTYLTFEPGKSAGYGPHLPFDMLSVLIENKSGESYADFLKKNFFDPLGMTDTAFALTEEQWARTVVMADRTKDTLFHNVEMGKSALEGFPTTYISAGGGLFGTLRDYFAFAEMLRQGGEYRGKRILKRDSAEKLGRPHVSPDIIGRGATTTFGLGVRVILKGYPFLSEGSYGWSGAYGTHFFIDPENEITAIYMKNTLSYDSLGAGRTGRAFEEAVKNSFKL